MSSCSQQTCDTSAFDAGMDKFERNKAIADKTFNLFIAKDLDGMMDMHSEDLIWSPASTNDTLSKAAFREGIAKARPVLLEPMMKVEVVTPESIWVMLLET